MSLIEMLLSILIVAFLVSFSTQYFRKKDRQIKSTLEELTQLNQRLLSLSHLRSLRYRLVFELHSTGPDKYWVEKKKPISLQKKPSKEDPALLKEEFEIDTSFYSEIQSLPSLLDIVEIETQKQTKQEGTVFIDYSNSFLAQEVKIQIMRKDNQTRWTLYLSPVTKELKILK